MKPSAVPYLSGCYVVPERLPRERAFPFDLPFVGPDFELTFEAPVTVLVGENGTGKSTVLESLACLAGLPAGGGARTELGQPGETSGASLAAAMRPRFRRRPRDGWFVRAETLFTFAETLDARARDEEFLGDPYQCYGGKSLHTRSHGEAFLAVARHRLEEGLFLFDEPEAALSPTRQVEFGLLVARLVAAGRTQVVLATHSPLLMTLPGASVLRFDGAAIRPARPEETTHWRTLASLVQDAGAFWRAAQVREGSREGPRDEGEVPG